MHYQVKVIENKRSYLMYLWWDENDTNSEVADSEICDYLLQAVSFPSNSNYTLKRTAVENNSSFGKDASETVMKNFYVDDLLKLVETQKNEVDLPKRVIEMCTTGAFNLTKFISYKKNVLMSTTEIHRRKSVKDTTERLLGVN